MRLSVVLLVLCSTLATTAEAQSLRRGLVRLEAGPARIHDRSIPSGISIAARAARVWRNDHLRLEAGIMRGTADGGFTAVDVAMELRGCPSTCRIVPYIAVALGGINDHKGAAPMSRLSVGLDLKLSDDRLLRFGLLRGTHGKGSPGPNGFTVGFTQRFGPSR